MILVHKNVNELCPIEKQLISTQWKKDNLKHYI